MIEPEIFLVFILHYVCVCLLFSFGKVERISRLAAVLRFTQPPSQLSINMRQEVQNWWRNGVKINVACDATPSVRKTFPFLFSQHARIKGKGCASATQSRSWYRLRHARMQRPRITVMRERAYLSLFTLVCTPLLRHRWLCFLSPSSLSNN